MIESKSLALIIFRHSGTSASEVIESKSLTLIIFRHSERSDNAVEESYDERDLSATLKMTECKKEILSPNGSRMTSENKHQLYFRHSGTSSSEVIESKSLTLIISRHSERSDRI